MLCLAAVALAITLRIEGRLARQGGMPVLPPVLLREPAVRLGLALSLTQFGAFFSLVFCLTLVLQDGMGLSPMQAGFSFAPLGCAFAAASIGMRAVVRRHGARVIVAGGFVACLAMAVIAALATARSGHLGVADVVVPLAVVGLGNGAAIPAVIGQVLQRVEPGHGGAASGLLTTIQQFASALGVAVIGGVFFSHLTAVDRAGHAHALAWAAGIDSALMVVVVGFALALTRLQGRGRR